MAQDPDVIETLLPLAILLLALAMAALLGGALWAFRALLKYAVKSWNLKISDQQIAWGEKAITDAVAAIEARAKRALIEGMKVKGDDKQHEALKLARELAPNGLAHLNDNIVRTKIDAEVEKVNRTSVRPPPLPPGA